MYSASINVTVTTHHRGNISPAGGKEPEDDWKDGEMVEKTNAGKTRVEKEARETKEEGDYH